MYVLLEYLIHMVHVCTCMMVMFLIYCTIYSVIIGRVVSNFIVQTLKGEQLTVSSIIII